MKAIIRDAIIQIYLRYIKKSPWRGNYSSWDEALRFSTGYDTDVILKKVADASKAVIEGRASYERDSILFTEPCFDWSLMGMIFSGQIEKCRKIVDFGGSLGSTFFQHRSILPLDVEWTVVEQEIFVKWGLENINQRGLTFAYSLPNEPIDVLLASCVLPYIKNPDELLKVFNFSNASRIVIANTPFSYLEQDIICIQHVPKTIYPASYPCRFVSIEKVFHSLNNYILTDRINSTTTIYHRHKPVPYQSLVFTKK
jgi:putative methyltransferase (TIGR04325 family)